LLSKATSAMFMDYIKNDLVPQHKNAFYVKNTKA
jgi:hypothetical protein